MLAQPYDWLLRLALDLLLFFIFLFVLLHPLWKLASTRKAMIIIFSRALGSFIRLILDLPVFFVNNILSLNPTPELLSKLNNMGIRTMETVLTVHNLAMAINRAHAVIFPVHYKRLHKRNFYWICSILWLSSLCVGISDQFIRTWTKYVVYLSLIVEKVCTASAALFYIAIGLRMVWINYKSAHAQALGHGETTATTELDSFKIMIVCLTCLLTSALRRSLMKMFIGDSLAWPDVPRTMFYWATNAANLMALCTEEICLAILVHEFRQNVQQQLRRLLLCCCPRKEQNNAETTFLQQSSIFTTQQWLLEEEEEEAWLKSTLW